MLLITCPWCGPREEIEFRHGGEGHIARPADAMNRSDAEYAQYLFMRGNPKGWHYERWNHAQGCRRWFNALRHTVTHEIAATYKPGEKKPEPPA
jgi:heterotetrameric sarcosine oxidase delta subunit